MRSLKGTRTEINILTAFAGESQARNRYDFFSGQAKKDGLVQIADIFGETANQEKEHAQRLFRFLEGGEVTITGAFPAGTIATTEANLIASAAGERHEYTHMYPDFAKIAQDEGFAEIATVMLNIARAEEYHEKRFLAFAKNIKEGRTFKREAPVVWRCRNCGYVGEGPHAPDSCPACAHPQAYFEVLVNPW
jgi:rubrerythrin